MATNEHDSLRSQSFSNQCFFNRRSFLKGSATLTAGFSALVGALELPVSTLTWMREANGVITATKNLTDG